MFMLARWIAMTGAPSLRILEENWSISEVLATPNFSSAALTYTLCKTQFSHSLQVCSYNTMW